jgi:hypothetical protein
MTKPLESLFLSFGTPIVIEPPYSNWNIKIALKETLEDHENHGWQYWN